MRKYKLVNSKPNNILLSQEGFTLVEVLIAIVLLAFISLSTFKMVDNSTDTKEKVLKEDQLLLQTLTATSRLDSDFSQLYSPLFFYSKANPANNSNAIYQDNATSKGAYDGKTKNGMIIPQFQAEDKSTIVFLTTSNRRKVLDSKESRFTWIRYSLRKSEKSDDDGDSKASNSKADQELVRQTISSNIYTSELNWSDIKAQVLLYQVKSADFSYWDERTKKYVNSLLDLNENKNTIRSIKLDLTWIDENDHEQKIEKVYRILTPYFNTKTDDLKTDGAYGDGGAPPGVPDPNNISGQGGSDVHF